MQLTCASPIIIDVFGFRGSLGWVFHCVLGVFLGNMSQE